MSEEKNVNELQFENLAKRIYENERIKLQIALELMPPIYGDKEKNIEEGLLERYVDE